MHKPKNKYSNLKFVWDQAINLPLFHDFLIDQIDQFGKTYLDKVDTRLASHDITLASIDDNVKNIQERAHVWDTFQHHATSWADLMTTVESKIDHISR